MNKNPNIIIAFHQKWQKMNYRIFVELLLNLLETLECQINLKFKTYDFIEILYTYIIV